MLNRHLTAVNILCVRTFLTFDRTACTIIIPLNAKRIATIIVNMYPSLMVIKHAAPPHNIRRKPQYTSMNPRNNSKFTNDNINAPRRDYCFNRAFGSALKQWQHGATLYHNSLAKRYSACWMWMHYSPLLSARRTLLGALCVIA